MINSGCGTASVSFQHHLGKTLVTRRSLGNGWNPTFRYRMGICEPPVIQAYPQLQRLSPKVDFKSEAEPMDMKTPKSHKSHKSHKSQKTDGGANQFLDLQETACLFFVPADFYVVFLRWRICVIYIYIFIYFATTLAALLRFWGVPTDQAAYVDPVLPPLQITDFLLVNIEGCQSWRFIDPKLETSKVRLPHILQLAVFSGIQIYYGNQPLGPQVNLRLPRANQSRPRGKRRGGAAQQDGKERGAAPPGG